MLRSGGPLLALCFVALLSVALCGFCKKDKDCGEDKCCIMNVSSQFGVGTCQKYLTEGQRCTPGAGKIMGVCGCIGGTTCLLPPEHAPEGSKTTESPTSFRCRSDS